MAKRELTLKDRLSRLSFRQACTLLGDEGDKRIMQGGKFIIPVRILPYFWFAACSEGGKPV